MEVLLVILVVALTVEAVWETLKMVWQDGKASVDRIGALILGVVLALGFRADVYKAIDVPVYMPYLGIILTGVLMSRGANFIHDFIGKITAKKPPGGSDVQG